MATKKTPKATETEATETGYTVLQPISVDNKAYKVDDPITLEDIEIAEVLLKKRLIAKVQTETEPEQ